MFIQKSLVALAFISLTPTLTFADSDGMQTKKGSETTTKDVIVKMSCEVFNGTRVQIVYSNNSNKNYTCSSTCYYKIGSGPETKLECTATAAANTSKGLFCGTNPYTDVRVTNPGTNNCP